MRISEKHPFACSCATALLFISFVLLFFFLMLKPAYGEGLDSFSEVGAQPWHEVHLKNGQSYDVSSAKNNTTVYIKEPGSYTLSGSSSKMRLLIESGNVTVYLANGLKITPGIFSYVGIRTAAISVGDQGGTVKLVSKAGSSSYFGSYLTAPAIRKDGRNTKLIFETEDSRNPGTIEAVAEISGSSAGIGGVCQIIGSLETGSMVFNSGNIIAKGGTNAAAIGGGNSMSAYDITINGGNIHAKASKMGAAIGGGYNRSAHNITINEGEVTAIGDQKTTGGAGIGGGGQSSTSYPASGTITINGGTVHAEGGMCSAGIGGGKQGNVQNIKITGGTVNAISRFYGNGIGGGGGNFGGTARNIEITGGTVSATGSNLSAGIGNLHSATEDANITITGGRVSASCAEGFGIGGGGKAGLVGNAKVQVNISGGTIDASGGIKDIGSNFKDFTFRVSGGSVYSQNVSSAPVNQEGRPLSRTDITLADVKNDILVTNAKIEGIANSYGLNDVQSIYADKLYFWLPQGSTVSSADTALSSYSGSVSAGTAGTLYPSTKLTLRANASGSTVNGYARVAYLAAKVTNLTSATRKGYEVTGYSLDSGGQTMLLSADGQLKKGVKGYTDDNGVWQQKAGEVTLYAQWKANSYAVNFDVNVPNNASTTPTGAMNSQSFTYDTPQTLTLCAYALPGYVFSGWNTQKDGSGTRYANEEEVKNLTSDKGAVVTLYAQWTARTYSVTFESNYAGSSELPYNQDLTFDQTEKLSACAFSYEDKIFTGWNRKNTPGSFYIDESYVYDACTIMPDGSLVGYTFEANWTDAADVIIVITEDDDPVDGLAGSLTLRDENANYAPFSGLGSGIYRYDPSSGPLPPGNYNLFINNDPTGVVVKIDNVPEYISLPYFTAQALSDAYLIADSPVLSKGYVRSDTGAFLVGSEIKFSAQEIPRSGYGFYQWTSKASNPIAGWMSDANPTTAEITGKTIFQANSVANGYFVAFNANQGQGSMLNQKFFYDISSPLMPHEFYRLGYEFSGWNTQTDGGGRQYADEEEIINLTTQKDKVIDFYTQWAPHSYQVIFDANGGEGIMAPQNFTYGIASPLTPNQFFREDWQFMGWNTDPGGVDVSYGDCQEVSDLTPEDSGQVMLYAQWEHDVYGVTYHANGGNGKAFTQEFWTNAVEYIAPNCFLKENATFVNWNTAADGSGTSYSAGDSVVNLAPKGENTNLYAQWNPETYSIIFNANGGNGTMPEQTMQCDKEEELQQCVFVRDGFSFTEWNTAADGSGTSYGDQNNVINLASSGETCMLYAQWKASDKSKDEGNTGNIAHTGDKSKGLLMLIGVIALASTIVAASVLHHNRSRRHE